MSVRPSVRACVRACVCPSVRPTFSFPVQNVLTVNRTCLVKPLSPPTGTRPGHFTDVVMAGVNGVCLALYIAVILMSMLPPYSSLHHQQGVGTPQEGIDTKFPVYSSGGEEMRNFSFGLTVLHGRVSHGPPVRTK
jgi:hypothetical protein